MLHEIQDIHKQSRYFLGNYVKFEMCGHLEIWREISSMDPTWENRDVYSNSVSKYILNANYCTLLKYHDSIIIDINI